MLQITSVVLFFVWGIIQCQQLTNDCGSPSVQPTDIYTSGDITARILGGKAIKDGSWPWLVALVKYGTRRSLGHYCGGTLVNEQWILTASHCVAKHSEAELIETHRIIPGRKNLWRALRIEGSDEIAMNISRVILHEKFDQPENSTNYDIALVKLAQPLKLSKQIHPVCLPTMHVNETTKYAGVMKNPENGRPVLFVAGWGYTQESGPPRDGSGPFIGGGSDRAEQVDIEMYNTTECEIILKGLYYSGQMICGGFDQDGKDSCKGDSGGPLIQKGEDRKWQLQGIVSKGRGCGHAGLPGIYTNVREFVPWILDTISKN